MLSLWAFLYHVLITVLYLLLVSLTKSQTTSGQNSLIILYTPHMGPAYGECPQNTCRTELNCLKYMDFLKNLLSHHPSFHVTSLTVRFEEDQTICANCPLHLALYHLPFPPGLEFPSSHPFGLNIYIGSSNSRGLFSLTMLPHAGCIWLASWKVRRQKRGPVTQQKGHGCGIAWGCLVKEGSIDGPWGLSSSF